jgi:hypothetical protein
VEGNAKQSMPTLLLSQQPHHSLAQASERIKQARKRLSLISHAFPSGRLLAFYRAHLHQCSSRVCIMPGIVAHAITLALPRLRQEHCESEAILGYISRPCFKNQKEAP